MLLHCLAAFLSVSQLRFIGQTCKTDPTHWLPSIRPQIYVLQWQVWPLNWRKSLKLSSGCWGVAIAWWLLGISKCHRLIVDLFWRHRLKWWFLFSSLLNAEIVYLTSQSPIMPFQIIFLKLALQKLAYFLSFWLLFCKSDQMSEILNNANLIGQIRRKLQPVDGHLLKTIRFFM